MQMKKTKILGMMVLMGLSRMVAAQDVHEHSGCIEDSINPQKEALLNEITVMGLTGKQRMKDSPIAFSVISPQKLHLSSGTNLVDIISRQPGMSQISTGAGIGKPVIRGLGYNRIVVVDQGIRQEGQQWGDEHGLEIDAQGVHSVEILKGPASLMYGSDAIAGVMILHPEHALPFNTMQVKAGAEYQSANGLYSYHAGFGGNMNGFIWNGHFTDKAAHCYQNARDGYVPGSWYQDRSLRGMVGWNQAWGHSWWRFSQVTFTPGITEGQRDETSGDLLWEEDNKAKSYQRQFPSQRVIHTKAISDNAWYLGQGTLKAIVGYQQNYRREYEEMGAEAELAMRLQTVNYDVRYEQTLKHDWSMATGVNGMWQQNRNRAEEMLIPDYRLFDFGYFLTANKQIRKWRLSGGARADNRHLSTEASLEEEELLFQALKKNFTGITGSLGTVYNANEHLNLRMNVARGFRAPVASELCSNGVHEGSVQYELGNEGLKAEFSTQIDVGMDYNSHHLSLGASVFSNWISNYIYLRRLPYETEGYRTYQYQQGDARLMGGEISVDVHPINALHFANAFSYVRGIQLHEAAEGRNLPMMPAPRWTCDLRYDIPDFARRHCQRTFVSVGMEYNLRQSKVYRVDDTETPTPAYALFSISAGMDLHVFGHNCMELSFTCQNLFDKVYQSHLSRLKYTDGVGIAGMGRNFCLKVNIPIDIHLKGY